MPGDNDHASVIPGWDGNPSSWETYKQEVRIWKLGTDFSVKYSPAARLLAKLTGSARRVAYAIKDEDLKGTEERPHKGVEAIMTLLEQNLSGEKEVRKGESMEDFFAGHKFARRTGERITDWISRWDEGVRKLSDDGIALENDLSGFFFTKMANLTAIRRELVLAKVPKGRTSTRHPSSPR